MQAHLRAARSLLALSLAACSAAGTTDTATGNDPGNQPQASGGESLAGRRPFPADNPWNTVIIGAPVDPKSSTLIASCGLRNLHPDFGTVCDGAPNGIPYVVVHVGAGQGAGVVRLRRRERSRAVSDSGRRADRGRSERRRRPSRARRRRRRVEAVRAVRCASREWRRELDGRIGRDLRSRARTRCVPRGGRRPTRRACRSFPGSFATTRRWSSGAINHALRFTCPRTRKAYVSPARHYASSDTSSALPPMGMRVRLKANFDTTASRRRCASILRAMMRYGMFVADNGRGWFVSGAPDPRWSDDEPRRLWRACLRARSRS